MRSRFQSFEPCRHVWDTWRDGCCLIEVRFGWRLLALRNHPRAHHFLHRGCGQLHRRCRRRASYCRRGRACGCETLSLGRRLGRRRDRRPRRGPGGGHRTHDARDFFVPGIRLKDPLVPTAGDIGLAEVPRDITEVPERDKVFGIEGERRFENGAGFG